ncbi:N-terminal part of putative diguanylate cyclase [Escherichia coli]|nr:N-terminal part of putative diguanylate cyclase [Escherichia coli]
MIKKTTEIDAILLNLNKAIDAPLPVAGEYVSQRGRERCQ